MEGRTKFEFGDINFGILYYSVAPGLVMYEVTNLSTMQFVPVPFPKTVKNLANNQKAARKFQKSSGRVPDFSGAARSVGSVISAIVIFFAVWGTTKDISMAWNTASQKLAFA